MKEKEEIIWKGWNILENINIPKDEVDILTALKEFIDMSRGHKTENAVKAQPMPGASLRKIQK